MADATAQRRALVKFLDAHPLVGAVDFTRDGFQTVHLELGLGEFDTDRDGATETGTPEFAISFGDCRETFFTTGSGQWYRQEFERTPDRVSEDWRPVAVEAIDEPSVEVFG